VVDSARAAGRDPSEITYAYNVEVNVAEDAAREPGVLAGPPEAVAERLRDFVQLGFSAFNFMLRGNDHGEQAERLATEVMPALR
jgi:alkanesulfonate monooxygenase SsuD/methylene tetrahydromethanopterin reductase-like flavin-dependent oxidoreductase (luciferase family)